MSKPCQKVFESDLFVPELSELTKVIGDALSENYHEVVSEVAACPDLRKHGFIREGIAGDAAYAEAGGILPCIFNPKRNNDVYTLGYISNLVGKAESSVVLGQGAGSTDEMTGENSEWTGNAEIRDGRVVKNESRIGYVKNMRVCPEVLGVRTSDCRGEFGCIGNLFFTDGNPGDVIVLKVKRRKAEKNWSEDPHDQEFIRIIRKAVEKAFPEPEKQIVLGGVMLVIKGKTVCHVMPPYFPPPGSKPGKAFPDCLGYTERMYFSTKQLIATTNIVSHQGKGLPEQFTWRPDHTHFFTADDSEAGHYHYDVDPDVIEQIAYLYPAKRIYKIEPLDKKE